jgi:hypothetical protein
LQGRHLRILFIECRQPVRQAYKLGVAAAAVLAASHAIANIVGGCACVCCSGDKLRRSSPNRHMASFALVLTWCAPVLYGYTCIFPVIRSSEEHRIDADELHAMF